MQQELTTKEQLVIETFEKLRTGYGAIAKQNILNNEFTGWREIIAQMTEEEITLANLKEPQTYGYPQA